MDIPKGTTSLEVSYKIKSHSYFDEYDLLVDNVFQFPIGCLTYDFTPACSWGKGIIKELPMHPYVKLNYANIFHHAPWVISRYTQEEPREKLRITILEVYPGENYEDTCISEIFALGEKRK